MQKTLQNLDQYQCILSSYIASYERVILHQLCHFKAHYNQTQSGFPKGQHSTTTLLLRFRDVMKRAMKTSEVTLGILPDYS